MCDFGSGEDSRTYAADWSQFSGTAICIKSNCPTWVAGAVLQLFREPRPPLAANRTLNNKLPRERPDQGGMALDRRRIQKPASALRKISTHDRLAPGFSAFPFCRRHFEALRSQNGQARGLFRSRRKPQDRFATTDGQVCMEFAAKFCSLSCVLIASCSAASLASDCRIAS